MQLSREKIVFYNKNLTILTNLQSLFTENISELIFDLALLVIDVLKK